MNRPYLAIGLAFLASACSSDLPTGAAPRPPVAAGAQGNPRYIIRFRDHRAERVGRD